MGLDMFLHKVKKEEVVYWRKANAIHAWFERNLNLYEDEELENCKEYHVSKEDLEKLVKDCKKVLASSKLGYKKVPVKEYDYDKREYVIRTRKMMMMEDTSVAEELMPTQSGFCFGNTFYDEGYVEDLKNTVEQVEEVLNNTDFNEYDIVYHAWW